MKKKSFLMFMLLLFVFMLVPTAHASAKKKIKFTKSKVTIDIFKGTSTTLKLKKKGITGMAYFTSSKPKVATVSSRGYVVARGKMGKTTITAYCGGLKTKCTVRVKSSKVTFDLPSYTFSVTSGYSSGINYRVKGSFKKPTWKSSNTKIATVNSIGKVTGKSCGKTVITGKVSGKTRKLTVYVLAKGVVAKAYSDFLAQELVPAGPNDIPTEQKYIHYSFTNIDQDGIGELAVFATEGGAGYSLYNNGTIYTYRNGKLLKYGNISHGISSPCTWKLHYSHCNVVISSVMHLETPHEYKEIFYQLKNDKLYTISQTTMTKETWSSGYSNIVFYNASGQTISEAVRDAFIDKLDLGSVQTNYTYGDDEYNRKKSFGY